ncbi:cysteinyl-tRNA synthetase [Stella humosa]|uniref:Cysteine--tRNA ligase n=1 Tax=Stella humosa TaxID=94 RepID=A0A3N1MA27_9PROT|nr:cysteine--tRNA ligase [Stella humosa]ROP99649.1 cysteinyl-tRNA synthetase [Stella humosa]
MTIRLHDTLTRALEPFTPRDPNRVGMYVCGPTVYDLAHVGNARPVVVFDVLFRLLRHRYGADSVVYARNVTDVDDKINAAARENGEPIRALTDRTLAQFHADMDALGALRPTYEPRATDHIDGMIAIIERLIRAGNAYEAEGHVLFGVPSFAEYGQLSRRNRDDMIAGARIDVAPYKRDPADFVLWKPSPADMPGWDSPWGRGRPGWHIECSAMSERTLGPTFDIHGGGIDLIFPHHENEIAQSVCANGGARTETHFARHWVHNGFVMVKGEKMSKSLGNFWTVRQLLDDGIPGEAIRLALLKTHYRQPLDLTDERIAEARADLDRFYGALRRSPAEGEGVIDGAFVAALEDDLNTPAAIDLHMKRQLGLVNEGQAGASAGLVAMGALLGLLQQSPEAWLKGSAAADGDGDGEIDRLVEARVAARKARDFAEADRIRKLLADRGIVLEDTAQGTLWRRAG